MIFDIADIPSDKEMEARAEELKTLEAELISAIANALGIPDIKERISKLEKEPRSNK